MKNNDRLCIGMLGLGVVGGAMDDYIYRRTNLDIRRVDPKKGYWNDLTDIRAAFIAIPVPAGKDDAPQDLSCLRTAINSIACNVPIFVRSSVVPGTCDEEARRTGKSIYAMPEFLTARTAKADFARLPALVGTGTKNSITASAERIKSILATVLPDKTIIYMTNAEAELAKYAHNCALATEVTFWNNIREISDKMNLDYDAVRRGAEITGFIDRSHTEVPGPDGKRGYGGTCFPLNMESFAKFYSKLFSENRFSRLLHSVIRENEYFRNLK